jgi:cytidylate kinase
MKKIIIAIDGLSSSGKSTMAKNLAKEIGYIYIDSGAMYRAVTLYCLEHALFDADGRIDTETLRSRMGDIHIEFRFNPQSGRADTYLNGVDVETAIRTMAVSERVSYVSAFDFVRAAMVEQQQRLGQSKGIVMDGRDIGTTVFPAAELKIFVTASPDTRARRRWEELTAKGQSVSYEEILNNVVGRDRSDATRDVSPLKQAPDALLLDNSHMTVAQQQAWLMEQYRRVVGKLP